MSERVVITGIGCISCFGMGYLAFIRAIGCGSSGIAPITRFDTADCRSRCASTIRDFDPAAFISPLKLRRVDTVGRVALACTRLLFEDAGGVPGAGGRDDIGIALGTFTAGLDSLVEYLHGLSEHGPTGVPAIRSRPQRLHSRRRRVPASDRVGVCGERMARASTARSSASGRL